MRRKQIFSIKRDRDELKVTFTKLGVMAGDLKVYNDLTDTQMREKIEGVARMANERPDCAWVGVVILSHGRQVLGEDEVLGVNGRGLRQSTVSCTRVMGNTARPQNDTLDHERLLCGKL